MLNDVYSPYFEGRQTELVLNDVSSPYFEGRHCPSDEFPKPFASPQGICRS